MYIRAGRGGCLEAVGLSLLSALILDPCFATQAAEPDHLHIDRSGCRPQDTGSMKHEQVQPCTKVDPGMPGPRIILRLGL